MLCCSNILRLWCSNVYWVNSLYATENYNHPLYAIGPTYHRHKKNPPHTIQWHTRDELYFSMAFRELTPLFTIDHIWSFVGYCMLDFYAIFVSWILYAGVHAQCRVRVIAYAIWHVCGFGCQLWLETSYMEVYVLESTCLNGFAFGCTSLWQKFVYNFRVPTLYVLQLFVKYIAVRSIFVLLWFGEWIHA